MSLIRSMEIQTPAGIQSTHIHTTNKGIIYFWKPEKDEHWYDHDTFKYYVEDLKLENLRRSIGSRKDSLFNLIFSGRRKLGEKAVANPDSVDRVNWWDII